MSLRKDDQIYVINTILRTGTNSSVTKNILGREEGSFFLFFFFRMDWFLFIEILCNIVSLANFNAECGNFSAYFYFELKLKHLAFKWQWKVKISVLGMDVWNHCKQIVKSWRTRHKNIRSSLYILIIMAFSPSRLKHLWFSYILSKILFSQGPC